MRRTSLGVVVALWTSISLWTSPEAKAQTQTPLPEITYTGGGSKAAAMGGAFVGVADDASAGYWNPAGLTQNDRVTMGLQFRYQRQRVQNRLDSPQPLSLLYNSFSRENIFNFNFAAFNSPVTVKGQRFYLSASWFRAQDESFEASYVLDDLSDLVFDPTGLILLDQVEQFGLTEGGVKVVSLAAATQLKEDKLSAGFGVNIYVGSAYDSARTAVDLSNFDVLANDYVDRQSVTDQTNRRSFVGLNFGFGAMYEIDRYTFGVAVKTPFEIKAENDRREANRVYERTPDTLLLESESSLLYMTDTKVELPLQVALGMVFRPQDNLMFAVDYEYKAFGKSKLFFQEDLLDPRSDFIESDPEWKDVHQVRLGMEYQFQTAWGTMPVRAGFRTEPLPYRHLVNVQDAISDITGMSASYELGDQMFGEVYTIGTGIQWSQVKLDLTYEYHTATRYQDGHFVDNLLKPDFIYLQNNRSQRLSLGFTGFF